MTLPVSSSRIAAPLSRRSLMLAAASLPLATGALAQSPRRIVAAGGVITEIFYALGEQAQLVGVDTTSLFPAEALKEKANVGYVRALSAEGVLSLKPTDVVAVDGAGPPDTIRLIAEAGVKVQRIAEENSEKGVVERIRAVGAFAGATDRAEDLARKVEADFAKLKRQRDALQARKRVLFILSLQNGRVMVGGAKTSADAIIGMAGGINAAAMLEGFKPLTDEGVIAAAPDVVLMMKHNDHAASPDQVFSQASLSATPAARTRALVAMDGLYLLGFGPRTADAARDLMAAIYGPAAVARGAQP